MGLGAEQDQEDSHPCVLREDNFAFCRTTTPSYFCCGPVPQSFPDRFDLRVMAVMAGTTAGVRGFAEVDALVVLLV
jgi:hypothetical protein